MVELPTGTVTFLFTDLEGSTRLWEEHPEAMQDALARHDEILRDAVVSHGGATDVVFGSTLALAAMIRAQRGEHDWPIAALHEALCDTRETGDRPEVAVVLDRAVVLERARAELGDDAYHAAITRGAAMTYEENLDYWINEPGRLMNDAPDA